MKDQKTVSVRLGQRSYDVLIGRGNIKSVGKLLKNLKIGSRGMLITNTKVKKLYGHMILRVLQRAGLRIHQIIIPDGERHKSFDHLRKIYDRMLRLRFERQSFVVALGGGVVGDLAGFAAATYARGIPFVQVPTTLLAQVDSCIGGKTAVNHPLGKNMIGAFYQPRLVIIDLEFLKTLPVKELRNGLAEIVKYGVIWDSRFFRYIENHMADALRGDLNVLRRLVFRSCQIKALVVSRDEKEEGLRTILNFGHTLGHALESIGRYKGLSHGQAIAAGMIFAARLALKKGLFSEDDFAKLRAVIIKAGLPAAVNFKNAPELINFMMADKKRLEGKARFVLPREIGRVTLQTVSRSFIEKNLV